MFVHEPHDQLIPIETTLIWETPELACRVAELCRDVEQRVPDIFFRIHDTDLQHLHAEDHSGLLLDEAIDSDLIFLALDHSISQPPESLRTWLHAWAEARSRSQGGLAVLRAIRPVPARHVHEIVQHPHRHANPAPGETGFHRFLQSIADRARVDLFWGVVESDLEQATHDHRFLPASMTSLPEAGVSKPSPAPPLAVENPKP